MKAVLAVLLSIIHSGEGFFYILLSNGSLNFSYGGYSQAFLAVFGYSFKKDSRNEGRFTCAAQYQSFRGWTNQP